MPEIISDLTGDEASCLMIMNEGAPLVDLGEHSRWHVPLRTLLNRGFVSQQRYPGGGTEYVITSFGQDAIKGWEDQSIRDVIEANNRVARQRPDAGLTPRQIQFLAEFYRNMTGRNPSEICDP
jgi:hypothetical protein